MENCLIQIASEHNISAKSYSRENLKTLFNNLTIDNKQKLTRVYCDTMFSDDTMFEICTYICSQECTDEIIENGGINFNREEFDKKIIHNQFQQKYSDFLKIGLYSCGGVEAFFANKTTMQQELKNKLNKKYKVLVLNYQDNSDEILKELIIFCLPRTKESELKTCTGKITHCVYILSYFFHYCDIFLDYVTTQ